MRVAEGSQPHEFGANFDGAHRMFHSAISARARFALSAFNCTAIGELL
jgi:hypothetical protein